MYISCIIILLLNEVSVIKTDIVIFGTGGHAKVVAEIIKSENKFNIKAFVSLAEDVNSFLSYPHIHQDLYDFSCMQGIVAIGDNSSRSIVVNKILKKCPSFLFVNAIHPNTCITKNIEIGLGNVIAAGVVINTHSTIGNHTIINTKSCIDHDCKLGDFSSVAPGVTIGGSVLIGNNSAVSLGSNIVNNIEIGSNVVIGAGSTVLHNLTDNALYFGTPAIKIRDRVLGEKNI